MITLSATYVKAISRAAPANLILVKRINPSDLIGKPVKAISDLTAGYSGRR